MNKDDKKIIKFLAISVVFLVLMTVSLFASVYFFNENVDIKEENIELSDSLRTVNTTLILYNDSLIRIKEELKELFQKSIESDPEQKGRQTYNEINKISNKLYQIGIHSLRADVTELDLIKQAFQDEGYPSVNIVNHENAPNWMAKENTVFYYAHKSVVIAGDMAESLKYITGDDFEIKVGAGLGVSKGKERWSFRIHYLPKENEPIEKLNVDSTSRPTDTNKFEVQSWFKKGYYRQHENIKLTLLDLDVKNGTAKIKVSDTGPSKTTSTHQIELGQTIPFKHAGNNYEFQFDEIGKEGKNPFTKAMFYAFRRID